MSPADRRDRALLFLLSFGSIWTLLGYLYGIAQMHVLAVLLGVPTLVAMGVVTLRTSAAVRDDVVLGVLGGLWGTVGYDLVRIPLHLVGFNPFAPIRSYGMFVTGASQAAWWTDVAGGLYHFSNGVTFGVMYAVVMRGRHLGWAVLFGLWLETLAILTIYGDIYGVRSQVTVWSIAYFAHLFYGIPLGWWTETLDRVRWARSRTVWVATTLVCLGVLVVLAGTWPRGTGVSGLEVTEAGITPGWSRVSVGTPVELTNHAGTPVSVEVVGHRTLELEPGARAPIVVERAGIVQVRAVGIRSAFVAVEQDGALR